MLNFFTLKNPGSKHFQSNLALNVSSRKPFSSGIGLPLCIWENMSLILLHWAVIMGRVLTEPGKKCLFAQLDQRSRHRGQLINIIFTESRRKDGKTYFRSTNALIAFLCSSLKMNVLSMSSKTDSNFHISALQRQPCLLKTNSPQKLFGDVVDYVRVDHLSIIV